MRRYSACFGGKSKAGYPSHGQVAARSAVVQGDVDHDNATLPQLFNVELYRLGCHLLGYIVCLTDRQRHDGKCRVLGSASGELTPV